MNHRPLRVANLIREELAMMIERELDIPPGTLLTVTEVEVSKKMDIAHVRVSVLPSAKTAAALKALQAARRDLQFALTRKLNIKPMPQIEFSIDHGPENAAAVEKALLGE